MSSAWQEVLRKAWTELRLHPAQTRQFRSQRVSSTLALDAYAALRAADDAPCLLIHATARLDALFEVGGMRLGVTAGERGPLLVLSLEDRDRIDLFTTVCADALSASDVVGADSSSEFLARLEAWRRFLRERRTGLSHEETVGLIGELTVLERVLRADAHAQSTWEAPTDGLHDFQRNGHAIEVKTSLGPSSGIRISSLDQLDTSGLRRLDLLHVRLIEAPDGRSLQNLVDAIAAALPDEPSRRAFENALLRRGLMPDDTAARSRPRVEVRAIECYAVGNTFPRLTRSVVPSAVSDALYTLELRRIADHAFDPVAVLGMFLEAPRQ
jgi:hypothetical protein